MLLAPAVLTLALCALLAPRAAAQPSDQQVIKDLTHEGTLSVKLTTKGARRVENLKYVWLRNAEIVREANIPGHPEIKLVVWGTAVYDIIAGKFVYTKFRVGSNSYLGIPNPTEADIRAVLDKQGTEKLVGNFLYNNIVSDVTYKVAEEPRWEWHKPESVSFNVASKFDMLSQVGKAVETVDQMIRVRLYADELKGPWQSMMSTPKERKVLSSREVSSEEYARLKREESLAMKEADSKAKGQGCVGEAAEGRGARVQDLRRHHPLHPQDAA